MSRLVILSQRKGDAHQRRLSGTAPSSHRFARSASPEPSSRLHYPRETGLETSDYPPRRLVETSETSGLTPAAGFQQCWQIERGWVMRVGRKAPNPRRHLQAMAGIGLRPTVTALGDGPVATTCTGPAVSPRRVQADHPGSTLAPVRAAFAQMLRD